MLSTLRVEQKKRPEEDSSDSDSGSELGLEPETDRYGFFLTDGSTDRSAGPSPALVRQREAKWISIIDQWERLLTKKTSKVKVQCQKGIPDSLRAKCWTLLSGATEQMKQQNNLYKLLDSQPALKHWEDVIERDLDRQFPFHEMFVSKDGHGQRSLSKVLKAYTQYKPEEGYCQAQGPVAAVLLMNMPAEEAFWCLVQICEQYLPGYYSPLLEGVLFDAAILPWVLKKSCPAAHKHLQRHGVEPLMFATDWLMCLFTRHLPFNTLLRVWDLFFCYGVRVLLQVAAVLVHRVLGREDQRKQCCGQMETLQRLRGVRDEIKDEEDDFIVEVLSVPLSARDLQKQTQKELERWQKDRPSSTFDPRGRCVGYQMAWARARDNMDECERKEREKGNLSVPLFRSASTLSLSPSKWRRGLKANSGEWKSGAKVVRHLSMGAKDDWRNWGDLNVKKVQKLQKEDDFDLKESEPEQETKQTDYIEECKNQQTEAQNVEAIPQIIVELETEQMEEYKEIESQTTEEEKLCQQENVIHLDPTHCQTKDVPETLSLSEEPSQKADENYTEVDDSKKGTQSFESPAGTDIKTITEMQENADTNEKTMVEIEQENVSANNLQSVKSLKQLATEAIGSPVLNTDNEGKHFENIENTIEGDTQQLNNDADRYLKKHLLEGECQCNESEIGMNEESHTQAEIGINIDLSAQDQTEDVTAHTNIELGQTNSQHHETQAVETEAEAMSQNKDSELKGLDEKEMVMESAMTDLNSSIDQINNVENNTNVENKEETTYCTESIDKQQSSVEEEVIVDLNTQALPVGTRDSSTPKRESSDCCTDDELATKNNITFHQTQDFITDNNQQFSYRSSGDFRVRKSSSSHGSRLARRLSEDLFTCPQKAIISNSPDRDENIETAQLSNPTEQQQSPSFTTDANKEAATQKEQQTCNPPKRFGIFHKFKGEKSRKQDKSKMQVPKIIIQDFSDEKEMGKVVKVQVDDKLTSRERRRQRREQKRKEKEEEQQQKKVKKLEKEEKRAQTKSKSKAASQSGFTVDTYAEAYF